EAVRVRRIARTAVVPEVERQEARLLASESRGHHRLGLANREMHQRATWERQQRLGYTALGMRVPVVAVLVHRVAHALGEVGLQLRRGYRDAVDEQHQVQRIVWVVGRMLY